MLDYTETIELLQQAQAQMEGSVWRGTVTWQAVTAALDLCVNMRATQSMQARLDLLQENRTLRQRLVEAATELRQAEAKTAMYS